MTTQLNPYLTFPGNAREAMEFYASVFGGDLSVSTFSEYGGAPEGLSDDGIMHARLDTAGGLTLMASDSTGEDDMTGPAVGGQRASSVQLSLGGEDADELRGYWQRLGERATVTVPLERQVWGDEFGMLTDEFGIAWMVNITSTENAAS